jgi:methylmalonyl-CoA mutase N-terminal domain/subunit
MLACIQSGWIQSEIQNAAYQQQREVELKQRTVVGVNDFNTSERPGIPLHIANPALEDAQKARLTTIRSNRNSSETDAALERLEAAARSEDNLMPHILRAVESYATVGEISDVFRKVHGEYQEAITV